uniref:Cytochrome b n=1 Tax=Stygobromus foliatus TaxID=1678291 RepID=A0A172QHF5_9CRUS|nr:cytochrome b [Stygobromus foliatus]
MLKFPMNKDPLMKVVDSTLITLPAPSNLSYFWNMGSLLSMCLIIQLVSGLLLAATFSASFNESFWSMAEISESVSNVWAIRYIHSNGASLFFICLYTHTARGLFYASYTLKMTWMSGVSILILTMATAFLGYVLPMSQMSYWGASVITNLFSEIPYIGPNIILLLWGDLSVHSATITRFFTFHFVLPFIILALVVVHITMLHQTGSSNPLGTPSLQEKTIFNKVYAIKDLLGVFIFLAIFTGLVFYAPMVMGDNENFTAADSSATPHHIQPEWYFLFAYAILRAVPNKLGGVMALVMSIALFYSLPYTASMKMKTLSYYPLNKIFYWYFLMTIVLLSWIGASPVEDPYVSIGQMLSFVYFSYFVLSPLSQQVWNKVSG